MAGLFGLEELAVLVDSSELGVHFGVQCCGMVLPL
jgi:hypothetical protein